MGEGGSRNSVGSEKKLKGRIKGVMARMVMEIRSDCGSTEKVLLHNKENKRGEYQFTEAVRKKRILNVLTFHTSFMQHIKQAIMKILKRDSERKIKWLKEERDDKLPEK